MSKGEKISLTNKPKIGKMKKKQEEKLKIRSFYFCALKKLIKILLAFLDRFKVVCEFFLCTTP